MKDAYIYEKLNEISRIIKWKNFKNWIPILWAIWSEWWLTEEEQSILTDEFKYAEIYVDDKGLASLNRRFFKITPKWYLFLSNYDNSNSKKLDTYLWKYPNITKLFYFLWWLCIWLIPSVIIFLNSIWWKN